ncbi:hypothetical protein BZG36_02807 [Bifiguratus adelaidae]|uniref:Uncharacterized protein n=1 Tax=Bifiguratus adelaidae TaxID=1938954 RepID=A0A261Y1S7_9FUNG|nr:hypothetical protein BZG36_02807 [Bifiguratus adelaidae]
MHRWNLHFGGLVATCLWWLSVAQDTTTGAQSTATAISSGSSGSSSSSSLSSGAIVGIVIGIIAFFLLMFMLAFRQYQDRRAILETAGAPPPMAYAGGGPAGTEPPIGQVAGPAYGGGVPPAYAGMPAGPAYGPGPAAPAPVMMTPVAQPRIVTGGAMV